MVEVSLSHQREFELRFLKSRGVAFQDLFSDLMEKAYAGDFCRVRPHGRTGDMKCDGYLTSKETVFQAYGPDDMRNVSRLLKKMEEDFSGAVSAWAGRMKSWTLVHNSQSGLPPQAVQTLATFRERERGIVVESWGFEELRRLLNQLSPDALRALLPAVNAESARDARPPLPSEASLRRYWAWLQRKLDVAYQRRIGELGAAFTLRVVEEAVASRLHSFGDGLAYQPAADGERRVASVPPAERGRLLRDATTTEKMSALLRERRCLLVLGDPGSGKSSVLRDYARLRLETLRTRGLKKGVGRTPVFIELWTRAANRTLFETIVDGIDAADARIGMDGTTALMNRGYLVVLMDGLDEVAGGLRRALVGEIVDLARRYPRCHFMVSSRRFPDTLLDFHRVEVAPLEDADISKAFRLAADARRAHGHDGGATQASAALRHLCDRPLTLSMLASLAARGEELPKTLFSTYERYVAWTLGWDHRGDRLASVSAATAVLEEVACLFFERSISQLPMAEWGRIGADVVRRLRADGIVDAIVVDNLLRQIAGTALIRDSGGELAFSHRTLQEFLVARAIARSPVENASAVARVDVGVVRFLCGSGVDVEPLLEEQLERCSDVRQLLPLVRELIDARGDEGRFCQLDWASGFAEEIGVHIDFLQKGEPATFHLVVDDLVAVCLDFGPKTTSILKNAASGIAWVARFEESRGWFELVLESLELFHWPGAPLFRRLANIGYFEAAAATTVSVGSEPVDENVYETVQQFIVLAHDDDFSGATDLLAEIEEHLACNTNAE